MKGPFWVLGEMLQLLWKKGLCRDWGLGRAGTRKIQIQILMQQQTNQEQQGLSNLSLAVNLDVDVEREIEQKSSRMVGVPCWLDNSGSPQS